MAMFCEHCHVYVDMAMFCGHCHVYVDMAMFCGHCHVYVDMAMFCGHCHVYVDMAMFLCTVKCWVQTVLQRLRKIMETLIRTHRYRRAFESGTARYRSENYRVGQIVFGMM